MPQPKIFLSYSQQDSGAADFVSAALRDVGLDVWRDAEQLKPGQNWLAEISRALSEAGYLIALLSRASVESIWVQQEWTAMLERQLHDETGVVVPLRLEDVEPPALLRPLQRIDLFPNVDEAIEKLVSFFLFETRPAWLVEKALQEESIETLSRNAELRAIGPAKPPHDAAATNRFGAATSKAWHSALRSESRTVSVLDRLDHRTIRRLVERCLKALNLKQLCWDFKISEGELEGNSFNEKVISLLQRLQEDGKIQEFLRWLAAERPDCVREGVEEFLPKGVT